MVGTLVSSRWWYARWSSSCRGSCSISRVGCRSRRAVLRVTSAVMTRSGRVVEVVREVGVPDARVGVADGEFAAWLAAHATDDHAHVRVVPPGESTAFLAPWPISVLTTDGERDVNEKENAELASLPRAPGSAPSASRSVTRGRSARSLRSCRGARPSAGARRCRSPLLCRHATARAGGESGVRSSGDACRRSGVRGEDAGRSPAGSSR